MSDSKSTQQEFMELKSLHEAIDAHSKDDVKTESAVDVGMHNLVIHPMVNLPGHLQGIGGNKEHRAVYRILFYYGADRLLITNDTQELYVRTWSGLWQSFSDPTTTKCKALTRDLLERCAVAASKEAEERLKAIQMLVDDPRKEAYPAWLQFKLTSDLPERFVREVAFRIAQFPFLESIRNISTLSIPRVSSEVLTNYDQAGVIPLDTGGAVDLHSNAILNEDALSNLWLADLGWAIPEPDFDLLYPTTADGIYVRDEIDSKFGEILDRMAYHLLGTSKCVDTIVAREGSWGKSALYDLLDGALPGMVGRAGIEALKERRQFTPHKKRMVEKRLVFFDESGMDKIEIDTAKWMALGDVWLDVEDKGEQEYSGKRTATAVLMGQHRPSIDTAKPGVDVRLHWLYEDLRPIKWPQQLYDDLVKHVGPGCAYARAYMIAKAREYHANNKVLSNQHMDGRTQSAIDAASNMLEAERNELDKALALVVQPGAKADFLSTDAVIELLKEHDLSGPDLDPRRVNAGIKIRFRGATPHRMNSGPLRNKRGFLGVKLI